MRDVFNSGEEHEKNQLRHVLTLNSFAFFRARRRAKKRLTTLGHPGGRLQQNMFANERSRGLVLAIPRE
jgi:hypothetical protein